MKRILFVALTVLFCGGLLCGCASKKRIRAEYPIFIKTIDRPDEGVDEVIMVSVSITGQWSVDDSDSSKSCFEGTIEFFAPAYHI